VAAAKRFVYILESGAVPAGNYTGVTADLDARLAAHHAGRCPHTADGRPCRIDVVIAFRDEQRRSHSSGISSLVLASPSPDDICERLSILRGRIEMASSTKRREFEQGPSDFRCARKHKWAG
jgi:hypothetical protein